MRASLLYRFRFAAIVIAALSSTVIAGVWYVGSEPKLNQSQLGIYSATDEDGNYTYPPSDLYVEFGQSVSLWSMVEDYDTYESGSAWSDHYASDGAAIDWTASGGTLSSDRTMGGVVTWTAPPPPAASDEPISPVQFTITATPDDDSTSEPGDPWGSDDTGNRNDAPGNPLTQVVFAADLYEFRSTGDMTFQHVDADASTGQPESGTMPWEQAKVSKGQLVTLNVAVNKEKDQFRSTTQPNWTDITTADKGFDGKYWVTVTVQNATLEGGAASAEFEMTPYGSYIQASGIKIQVSPTWNEQDITVNMVVKDLRVVPKAYQMKPGKSRTAIQDMAIPKTLTLKKSTSCPATMTGGIIANGVWDVRWQVNYDLQPFWRDIYSDQQSRQTGIFYRYGPDVNGPGDGNANFAGETVTETFGEFRSDNFSIDWIQPKFRMKYPNGAVDDIIKGETPKRIDATFTINSQDVTSDYYSLTICESVIFDFIKVPEGLPPGMKDKDLSISFKQYYRVACGGPDPLQTNTLWSRWRWPSQTPDKLILRQQIEKN